MKLRELLKINGGTYFWLIVSISIGLQIALSLITDISEAKPAWIYFVGVFAGLLLACFFYFCYRINAILGITILFVFVFLFRNRIPSSTILFFLFCAFLLLVALKITYDWFRGKPIDLKRIDDDSPDDLFEADDDLILLDLKNNQTTSQVRQHTTEPER